jgi:uncharacterized protein (TIGR03067 family)
MKRLLLTALAFPCLAIGLESFTSAGDDAKKPLQGVWIAQSVEADGKPAPAEAVKSMRMPFKGEKLFLVGNSPDGREDECVYTVDPAKSPKHLDFTPPKEKKAILALRAEKIKGTRGAGR